MAKPQVTGSAEKYLTLKQAAELLNLPYYKIQRAVRNGLIPTHQLFNSRKYVLESEVRAAMAAL